MVNFKTIVAHGPKCGEIFEIVCEDHAGNLCRDAALACHKTLVDVYGLDPSEDYWYAFDKMDFDNTIDSVVDGFGWIKVSADTI